MKGEELSLYIKKGMLQKRTPDLAMAHSLLESSRKLEIGLKSIPFSEDTSTIIFKEYYEALKQIGDAKLWTDGYEARSHEPSMKALLDAPLQERWKLEKLSRFRQIRNDANYRGHIISLEQAKEIRDFWSSSSKELFEWVEKKLK
jgi:hypothetical protein